MTIFRRKNRSIEVFENEKYGVIKKWTDSSDSDDHNVREVEETYIKINSIENREDGISLDYEEVEKEEVHQDKLDKPFVEEIADELADKLDSKKVLKDALSELPEDEREEIKEYLEENDEDDVEVKNKGGCHELIVGDNKILVRA